MGYSLTIVLLLSSCFITETASLDSSLKKNSSSSSRIKKVQFSSENIQIEAGVEEVDICDSLKNCCLSLDGQSPLDVEQLQLLDNKDDTIHYNLNNNIIKMSNANNERPSFLVSIFYVIIN